MKKPPVQHKAGVCHSSSHPHSRNEKGGFFISTCGLSVLQNAFLSHDIRTQHAQLLQHALMKATIIAARPDGPAAPRGHSALSFVITDARRPGDESALKTSHSSTCSQRENSHKVSYASFSFLIMSFQICGESAFRRLFCQRVR